MRTFVINANEAGQRFDKYLKKLLPNAGTGFLYKMLRKKNITLDGAKASGKEMLKEGSLVDIFFSDETLDKFMQDTSELSRECERLKKLPMKGLKVIYEDDDILIADKPANMLSQKAASSDISANEYLLGYLLRTGFVSEKDLTTFRPSVCNRLDRNTTGLILMGKSLSGSQELSRLLKDRSVRKFYRAIVAGRVTKGEHLKGWLIKDEKLNQVKIFPEEVPDASYIETAYEPVTSNGDFTLLEIHLITGRTHQIRAHLASIGHPIVGDPKYGDAKNYKVKSQLLHAYRLEFPDGRTFTAKEPKVFGCIFAKNMI